MAETWESKEQPERLFRLQGYLNLTRNVEEVVRTDDQGNEETVYTYDVVRLKDRSVPADIPAFELESYAELRQAVIMSHWPQEKQNEAVTEDAMGRPAKLAELTAFIESVREEFPSA